ncbi:hypothetical protein E4T56_gene10080 [Termitomyces sp. T112]|nr:hypothetical protein E4T56_gene10080 [Termitomyces sp. T112]
MTHRCRLCTLNLSTFPAISANDRHINTLSALPLFSNSGRVFDPSRHHCEPISTTLHCVPYPPLPRHLFDLTLHIHQCQTIPDVVIRCKEISWRALSLPEPASVKFVGLGVHRCLLLRAAATMQLSIYKL